MMSVDDEQRLECATRSLTHVWVVSLSSNTRRCKWETCWGSMKMNKVVFWLFGDVLRATGTERRKIASWLTLSKPILQETRHDVAGNVDVRHPTWPASDLHCTQQRVSSTRAFEAAVVPTTRELEEVIALQCMLAF